jgi:YHS domain-containing protein
MAVLALPALADNKMLVNTDEAGVALQGYDPVAFFTDKQPVKGDPKFVTKRDGAIYFFTSKAHKDLFVQNPAKYEPCFGGYCAYGVSRKKLVEIDVSAFQIMDAKLLLQYSKDIRDKFNEDAQGNLAKADANWPVLIAKKGK